MPVSANSLLVERRMGKEVPLGKGAGVEGTSPGRGALIC